MTYAQLLVLAKQIKTETAINANTHTRVGLLLEEIIKFVEDNISNPTPSDGSFAPTYITTTEQLDAKITPGPSGVALQTTYLDWGVAFFSLLTMPMDRTADNFCQIAFCFDYSEGQELGKLIIRARWGLFSADVINWVPWVAVAVAGGNATPDYTVLPYEADDDVIANDLTRADGVYNYGHGQLTIRSKYDEFNVKTGIYQFQTFSGGMRQRVIDFPAPDPLPPFEGPSNAEVANRDGNGNVITETYVSLNGTDRLMTEAEATKLAGVNEHWRGTFITLAALKVAIPTGAAGNKATIDAGVGSQPQEAIWDTTDNDWYIGSGIPITVDNAINEGSSNAVAGGAVFSRFHTTDQTIANLQAKLIEIEELALMGL